MTKRTSHIAIQGRFLALCLPVGIVLALLMGPFAILAIIVFFVTLLIFFNVMRFGVNGIASIFTPDSYQQLKSNGGDPFYDSLGAPLNFDSEETRRGQNSQNLQNMNCPRCGPTQTNNGYCSCGLCFNDNHWWEWVNGGWILYGQRNIPASTPSPQIQTQTRTLWTGQNVSTTR